MMLKCILFETSKKIITVVVVFIFTLLATDTHDNNQHFAWSIDNFQRNIPALIWEETYGGTGEDRGIQSYYIQDNHTVITAGTTIEIGQLNTGVYVLKTSTEGSIIWERNYGLLSNNNTVGMVINHNNEIILCANSRQVDQDETGPNFITLYQLDQRGLLKNEIIFDEFPNHYASKITMITDGSFIIIGSAYDEDQFDDELFIIQLNSEFDIIWKQKLAKGWMITAHDIIETHDDHLLILSTMHVGRGQLRIMLQNIDIDGKIHWYKIYGHQKNYMGCSIIATYDHHYLILGETDAYNDHVGVVLIKINADGDPLWERFFQQQGNTIGRSIVETCNHGFLIAGATNISIDDMLYHAGRSNGYLLHVDSFGIKIWEKNVGGHQHDFLSNLIKLPDSSYILTGRTSSHSIHGDMDLYLAHLNAFAFGRPRISIYPDSLYFGVLDKNINPTARMVYIFNEGLGNLTGYINPLEPWIKTSDKNFIIPTFGFLALPINIDVQALAEGDYSGQIQLSTNGGTAVIKIYCNIIDNAPILQVNPGYIKVSSIEDRSKLKIPISIVNGGRQNLFGRIHSSVPWITLSLDQFFSNQWETTAVVHPSMLNNGNHQGEIHIQSNGGNFTIPVNVTCNFPVITLILTIGKSEAMVNQKQVYIDPDNAEVVPVILNNRTMVPLRFFSETFGAQVKWNAEQKTILVQCLVKEISILIQVNHTVAVVNGKEIELDVSPSIIQNRVFVPLRFLSESFRASIEVDQVEGQPMSIIVRYEL